jgi:general secretion pathway protein L
MSTLLFTLPMQAANGSALPQHVLSTHEAGARDKEIWAIVPATALSWQRIELPAGLQRQTQRLQTALHSLLEEPLLDEADAVHMALQPNWQAGQSAWVAVCNKAWLQGHLVQLQAGGHAVHRIVPEWTPTMGAAADISAWIGGTPADAQLWVHDAQGAWHLPLQAGLQHWVDQLNKMASTGVDKLALNVAVLADPAVADLALKALSTLQAQTHSAVSERLQTWRIQVTPAISRYRQAADTQWDLAQFEFAANGSARWRQAAQRIWQNFLRNPEWRPVRWCAGLLVATQLAGLNMAAWQLNAQVASQKELQKNILKQSFPHVTVVDAPLQMAKELSQLQSASGTLTSRDLEHALQATGAALPAGQSITGIDYTAQGQAETKLQGLQLSGSQAAAFAQALRAQQLDAQANGAQWRITPLKEAP